ncbi:hypothetical protein ABPG74_000412 [Tetrahymena malaccensis]
MNNKFNSDINEPKQQQSQLDYCHFDFSKKHFKQMMNQEEFYLCLYDKINDLLSKKQLILHNQVPLQDNYEAGMCFVYKRPASAAMDRIIYSMNGTIYSHSKKKVVQLEKLVYLDGLIKKNKQLGIRVVKILNKGQSIKNEFQDYFNLILIHIYEIDVKERENIQKQQLKNNFENLYQNKSHEDQLNLMMQQEDQEFEDSVYIIPPQEYMLQSEQSIKVESFNQQNKSAPQEDQIESQTNYIKEQNISQKPHDQILKQENQLNVSEKPIQDKTQLNNLSQLQKQAIQPKKEAAIIENQNKTNSNNSNLKLEPPSNQINNNQMQSDFYHLAMKNGELLQIVFQQEIENKNKELLELTQKLNQLKEKTENLKKNPNQFDQDYLNYIQNIKFN